MDAVRRGLRNLYSRYAAALMLVTQGRKARRVHATLSVLSPNRQTPLRELSEGVTKQAKSSAERAGEQCVAESS